MGEAGVLTPTIVTSSSVAFRMVPNAADIPVSAVFTQGSDTVNGVAFCVAEVEEFDAGEPPWAHPASARAAAARTGNTGYRVFLDMIVLLMESAHGEMMSFPPTGTVDVEEMRSVT
jgi:hypothetical protein